MHSVLIGMPYPLGRETLRHRSMLWGMFGLSMIAYGGKVGDKPDFKRACPRASRGMGDIGI